jgi:hypothetical protein
VEGGAVKSERDTTRIVRSWLESGVTDLPDRVLDQVLDQLPTTPQRRHQWQARRSYTMNSTLKMVIAAAAVVVVGVVGFGLVSGSSVPGVGASPTATPSAAPTPVPSASPILLLPSANTAIEPGRYRISSPVGDLSIDVPAGWISMGSDILRTTSDSDPEAAAIFAVWPISGTFADPCTDHTLVQPTPGAGIDDLADALANQPGTEAGPPTAVTVDGYAAKRVDSTVTADIEPCGSGSGMDGFWLYAMPDGDRRYVQGTNELNQLYIVDVDGQRLTFNGRLPAAITAVDRAELEAIIASIDIEP